MRLQRFVYMVWSSWPRRVDQGNKSIASSDVRRKEGRCNSQKFAGFQPAEVSGQTPQQRSSRRVEGREAWDGLETGRLDLRYPVKLEHRWS